MEIKEELSPQEKKKLSQRNWYQRNRNFLRDFEKSHLFHTYRNLRILINKKSSKLKLSPEVYKILDYQKDLLKIAVYKEKKRLRSLKNG